MAMKEGSRGDMKDALDFRNCLLRLKPASQMVLKRRRRAIALGVSGDEILQSLARTSETEFRGQCARYDRGKIQTRD